jgi:hypothetical protein
MKNRTHPMVRCLRTQLTKRTFNKYKIETEEFPGGHAKIKEIFMPLKSKNLRVDK